MSEIKTFRDLFLYWAEESFKLYKSRIDDLKTFPLTDYLTKEPVEKVNEKYEWKLKEDDRRSLS